MLGYFTIMLQRKSPRPLIGLKRVRSPQQKANATFMSNGVTSFSAIAFTANSKHRINGFMCTKLVR